MPIRVKPETSVGVGVSGVKRARIEPPPRASSGEENEVRYRVKKPSKSDRDPQRCVGPVKDIQVPAAATTLKVGVVEGKYLIQWKSIYVIRRWLLSYFEGPIYKNIRNTCYLTSMFAYFLGFVSRNSQVFSSRISPASKFSVAKSGKITLEKQPATVWVIDLKWKCSAKSCFTFSGSFGPGYQLFEVSSDIANDEQFLSVLSDDILNVMIDLDLRQNGDLSEQDFTFNVSSSAVVRESPPAKSRLDAVDEKRFSENQSSSTNESTSDSCSLPSHLNESDMNDCDKSVEEDVLRRQKRLENILKKFV